MAQHQSKNAAVRPVAGLDWQGDMDSTLLPLCNASSCLEHLLAMTEGCGLDETDVLEHVRRWRRLVDCRDKDNEKG